MGFHKLLQTLALPLPATWTATAGCATLMFFFLYGILHKSKRNGGRLPPGPYPWLIIGNIHQIRKPVHRALKGLADKYGAIMFLRWGSVPTVVVSSSEIAKHFLKTHDFVFASRPTTAAGKYLSYNFKGMILSPYGDYWRQMRKFCMLELLTSKRVESFKHVREEEVSAMIRTIWEESQNGTIAVNVSKVILALSSNVIWRILARRKVSDDDLGADGKGFKHMLVEMSSTVGELNIGDFIPYLDWMDLQGVKRRMMKLNKTYDAFAEKIIDEHLHVHHRMAAPPSSDGQTEAEHVKDFVDVLLQMTAENDHIKGDAKARRETIKAIIFDMVVAGIETSSSTLEWTMSELLRHPHVVK
jgi:cytochrome P450